MRSRSRTAPTVGPRSATARLGSSAARAGSRSSRPCRVSRLVLRTLHSAAASGDVTVRDEHEVAVDSAEMARILNVSRGTVVAMVRRGDIPGFKAGRHWRFMASKVIAHLERSRDPWAQSYRSLARKRTP
ncbi:helix-turn-helix domain-containing protein [Microbacterium immunditiarum]|uniref:helix-turn-helix domain-containing protein n=1 Tax=Microbacterium immunditiarum TaxID=337480 RepID=UPI003CCCDA7C